MHPLKTIDLLLHEFKKTGRYDLLKLVEEISKLYLLNGLLLGVGSLLKYIECYLSSWKSSQLKDFKRIRGSIEKVLDIYKELCPQKVEALRENLNNLYTKLERLEQLKMKVFSLSQLYLLFVPLAFADPILAVIAAIIHTAYIVKEIRKMEKISSSAWELYDITTKSLENLVNPAEWYKNKIKIEKSLKTYYNGRLPWESS